MSKVKGKPAYKELEGEGSASAQADKAWEYAGIIKNIFTGQHKSSLQCSHCAATSYKFDDFVDLNLPLPQKSNSKHVCTIQVKCATMLELKYKHMNV